MVVGRGNKKDYTPEKKIWDSRQFKPGGRMVTFYHIPGHTREEYAAVDDNNRILFIGDACNYLLGENIVDTKEESTAVAIERFEKRWRKRNAYDRIYNSRHDCREEGCLLADTVLPNLMECLREIKEGTCRYSVLPDMLFYDRTKKVAVYGNVQVTYLGGEF